MMFVLHRQIFSRNSQITLRHCNTCKKTKISILNFLQKKYCYIYYIEVVKNNIQANPREQSPQSLYINQYIKQKNIFVRGTQANKYFPKIFRSYLKHPKTCKSTKIRNLDFFFLRILNFLLFI